MLTVSKFTTRSLADLTDYSRSTVNKALRQIRRSEYTNLRPECINPSMGIYRTLPGAEELQERETANWAHGMSRAYTRIVMSDKGYQELGYRSPVVEIQTPRPRAIESTFADSDAA